MQCKHIKPDGTACKGFAMKSSDYCFSHNPKTKQQHLEAVKKGGEAMQERNCIKLDPIPVEDALTTAYLITDTINRIRVAKPDGTMDLRVANSVGFLSSKLLECRKQMLYEESILKDTICKEKKVDTATFRQLMSEYNDDFLQSTKEFIDGAEKRYAEYKRANGGAFNF